MKMRFDIIKRLPNRGRPLNSWSDEATAAGVASVLRKEFAQDDCLIMRLGLLPKVSLQLLKKTQPA